MKYLLLSVVFLFGCGTAFDPRNSYDQYMDACQKRGFDANRCQTDWANKPRTVNRSTNPSIGISFLCKDAMSRGDNEAIFVHCN